MRHVLVLFAVFGHFLAETSSGQGRDEPGGSGRRVSRSRVEVLLLQRVEQVSWDEAPFAEIVDWVRNQSDEHNRVNVMARWRALDSAGVDRQSSITLQMAETTVGQVLTEVLGQISGRDPLVYVGEDNTLKITSRSDMRRKLYTRSYDVAEIVTQSRGLRVQPRFFSGQQVDFGAVTATPGAGLGGTSQTFFIGASLFGDPADDDDDDDVTDAELAERVIEAIVTTVAPESWRVNGGLGTLSVIDGVLIVRNSADVHELLGGAFRLDD